jgi:V/A-type H+-transporting ATPase subunit F
MMENNYRIAALGGKESICGFSSLGVECFPTDDAAEAAKTMHTLAGNGCAVVFLTESLAAAMGTEWERYRDMPLPAVILIPGVSGNTGAGMAAVSRSVEQAVGSDIIN